MPSNSASMLSSSDPSHASGRSEFWESGQLLELEEGEERSEPATDRELDATYVEVLEAIKVLLEIQDPECDNVHPSCAFNKRPTLRSNKRQLSAFPPDDDVASMWAYRASQASGKYSSGVLHHEPFNTGHLLPFQRVNMSHYSLVPQSATLKAQQVPQGFGHLYNRSRTPSNVYLPMKQHMLQERIVRECVQILERVLHFKRAMAQISKNVTGFAQ